VLDFGLVKAVEEGKNNRDSGSDMSGTPLYMSPESIQTPESVDACSDLYAVGAVGYFLLTGETAFSATTLGELCQQHLTAIPDPPSQRLGRAISAELEHAILACLEKNRAKRPQTARDLAAMLERVTADWSLDQAEEWWSRYERGQQPQRVAGGTIDAAAMTRAATTSATLAHKAAPTDKSRPKGDAGLERTMFFDGDGDTT
jgi:serine/threonine protein kinase